MRIQSFQSFQTAIDLSPAPIAPAWIREGCPVARNAVVARSADKSAYTMIWDCTAGKFDWTYDCDETVHILEGSILLSDAGNPAKRLGPGDAVFFPKGAQVSWEVEGYVKKLAFMREALPAPVSMVMKAHRRLKRWAAAPKRLPHIAERLPASQERSPPANSFQMSTAK